MNYCPHFPILQFLGASHRLQLLYIDKGFIYIEEIGELINEFYIVYMINRTLHFNKAFKEQVGFI